MAVDKCEILLDGLHELFLGDVRVFEFDEGISNAKFGKKGLWSIHLQET